jgi:cell division protein FtsB
MSAKETIYKIGLAGIVTMILIGSAFILSPIVSRRSDLIAKSEELSRKIENKKHEIAELREKQVRFQNDTDFIESVARQNNRVYPGELVFIFED